MCDADKITRARSIIDRAESLEKGGQKFTPEAELYLNRAIEHLQDERGHLALFEANKLAAEMGIS